MKRNTHCRFLIENVGSFNHLQHQSFDQETDGYTFYYGPCCSSVGHGAFAAHGPFKPTRKDHLMKNQLAQLILQTKSTKISLKRIPGIQNSNHFEMESFFIN
ncbi:uncharacterized protein LOC123890081 [Trifolium pratense]|uniref:uncharacterized protein LOC123890081 n=1 Tax=Trifolium pratense TaxID=57577 RepID=UPI001E6964E3|nr:uncharacterized protein LOC123890081 [Trifolium pratense]